jgi:hypothetical protein
MSNRGIASRLKDFNVGAGAPLMLRCLWCCHTREDARAYIELKSP